MDIHGQVSCACQGTHDHLGTTGPEVPSATAQVLTNFLPQMWVWGGGGLSYLDSYLLMSLLGAICRHFSQRSSVTLDCENSIQLVPTSQCLLPLWSLGRWDWVSQAGLLGWHWDFTVLAGTPPQAEPSLLLFSE